MRRLLLPAVAALAVSPALAACGSDAADDGRLSVIASFYPVAFVAEQVGGDAADVDVLSQPGVDAHDLELAPRQVASVQDADVVVYQEGFQAAVDDAVEQGGRDPETVVDSAAEVDLIEGGEDDHDHAEGESHEGHDHAEGESHEGHDHGDEESHDHAEGEDHDHAEEETHEGHDHDHDHGGVDPHVWLDPANMVALTRQVEQAFSAADPAAAETFRSNAEALVADLEQLQADLDEGLRTCETRDIVTSHAAFAYLARAQDLHQVAINGIDPSNEPSAAQLAELSDLVRDEGITTVFTERIVSSAVADTVAREAGVETAVLDPIEGLTDDTADEDYISLMRQNLEAIAQANGCS